MNVYLDIETVPTQSESEIAVMMMEMHTEKAAVKAPSNYKDPAKIDEYIAAKQVEIESEFDQRYRKTSFDGALGQIVAISFAIDDEPVVNLYAPNWKTDENVLIADFYRSISVRYKPSEQRQPVFIGHNLVGFDLRFLFQRSVLLGVKPPLFVPFAAKPWDQTVFDTMLEWAGHGKTVSLAKLCRVFQIDAKGAEIGEEIDGSKVWDFVKAGRIADVAKYCGGDVERTRLIHKRLSFEG
jgi:predicted PolB exonuclease-like 3'-5' exonuclease